MTNLDRILKSRDITLPTNVHRINAMFSSIMYGCERWSIKKAGKKKKRKRKLSAEELMLFNCGDEEDS